jgi:hypothetical protein
MPFSASFHPYVAIGIGALIAWRVYVHVRRAVRRRPYKAYRAWATVLLFPLAVAMLLLSAVMHKEQMPTLILALLLGGILGVTLGVYGLRHTRFDTTDEGLFYTPNAHIGIALSLLLVGRVLYRVVELYMSTGGITHPPDDFARSPLTLAIVGTLVGYYVTYAVGLIRYRRWLPGTH